MNIDNFMPGNYLYYMGNVIMGRQNEVEKILSKITAIDGSVIILEDGGNIDTSRFRELMMPVPINAHILEYLGFTPYCQGNGVFTIYMKEAYLLSQGKSFPLIVIYAEPDQRYYLGSTNTPVYLHQLQNFICNATGVFPDIPREIIK